MGGGTAATSLQFLRAQQITYNNGRASEAGQQAFESLHMTPSSRLLHRAAAWRLSQQRSPRVPQQRLGCAILQRPLSTGSGQTPDQDQPVYLHIAPCGDHWQGPEIFAAKHMTAGYVKSFPVPASFSTEHLDEAACQAAYDTGALPLALSPPASDELVAGDAKAGAAAAEVSYAVEP